MQATGCPSITRLCAPRSIVTSPTASSSGPRSARGTARSTARSWASTKAESAPDATTTWAPSLSRSAAQESSTRTAAASTTIERGQQLGQLADHPHHVEVVGRVVDHDHVGGAGAHLVAHPPVERDRRHPAGELLEDRGEREDVDRGEWITATVASASPAASSGRRGAGESAVTTRPGFQTRGGEGRSRDQAAVGAVRRAVRDEARYFWRSIPPGRRWRRRRHSAGL